MTDRQTNRQTDRHTDTVRYRSDYPSLNNKHENIEVDIIKDLQSKVIECEKIISGLKTELEQARDTTVRLNEELCYTKRKFENEKNLILKDHLSDMITWKKDMCEISKKHSDLQTKFELVSTDFQLE